MEITNEEQNAAQTLFDSQTPRERYAYLLVAFNETNLKLSAPIDKLFNEIKK